MFKVNNKDTSSVIFIVNFEHILHFALVFLLLTLNMQLPPGEYTKRMMPYSYEEKIGRYSQI